MTDERLEQALDELQREANEYRQLFERGTYEAAHIAAGIEIAIRRIRKAMEAETE